MATSIGSRGLPLTLALLGAVVVVHALSIWALMSSRADAERDAEAALVVDAEARARAVESLLGSTRGDLAALASALAGAGLTERERLAPRALLQLLETHPILERLVLFDVDDRPLAVATRLGGTAYVVPAERVLAALPVSWEGRFEVAAGSRLEARIDPLTVASIVGPGLGKRLQLERDGGRAAPAAASSRLVARARFRAAGWTPELSGLVVRREDEAGLVDTFEELAARYRTAMLVNGSVMTLSLVLGLVAWRQARRRAELEAAHRYEAEKRELERRLFHHERLSSLGRLAAGMAHEINNPLEGMANYLALLAEDLRLGRLDDAPRYLTRVREGLDRAASTVRQVLAFAAPDHPPNERLDLAALVAETVRFVREDPAHAAIRITYAAPSTPFWISGHRHTLGQVLLNLMLNACKAQPKGGEIEVGLESAGDAVCVRVADRGPGIDPAIKDRLFEPFVSGAGSTGLGLAVCHGIVSTHGGSIEAADRTGGGAVFTVWLPRES